MSNGFLVRLTFGVNNLMWSTNACDIFVDCFCSDTFSFAIILFLNFLNSILLNVILTYLVNFLTLTFL